MKNNSTERVPYRYKSAEEVLKRAREIYRERFHTFQEIDVNNRLLNNGKGSLGVVVEEGWFGLPANNLHERDFPEAGLELKVIPYLKKEDNSYSGKERLVVSMINYQEEAKITKFEESSFWKKADRILIMTYEHVYSKDRGDYFVDCANIFTIPLEDLEIIRKDWELIHNYIVQGKAHELSESLTNYLGACTKGANGDVLVNQPNSPIRAKPRAYSLKGSYITYLIKNSLLKNNTYSNELFINETDSNYSESRTDINYIESRLNKIFSQYLKQSVSEIAKKIGYSNNSKNINSVLVKRIIKEADSSLLKIIDNSSFIIKTVVVTINGKKKSVKESMSFAPFRFIEILNESWDDSSLKEFFEDLKLSLFVFEKISGITTFKKIIYYTIHEEDLENIKSVYCNAREKIKKGKVLNEKNGLISNNFPKSKDNPVAHIRPHAAKADYSVNGKNADYLPVEKRWMTRQSFWLNRRFIQKIIIKEDKK